MEILTSLGLLIAGFAILIVGGESLVKAAVSLSLRWKVSPAVIGLTIIAAGTSAPELVTSLIAAFKNSPDIALGNVVGSNLFNTLLVIGFASLIKANRVEKTSFQIDLPFSLIAVILLFGLAQDQLIQRWEGFFFLVLLNGFLLFSFWWARRTGELGENLEEMVKLKNGWWEITHLVIGVVALIGGANMALEGGILLGKLAGLSDRVIGLTIIATGTSLPELATSGVAAYRGRNDIAVSNVIGSNIFNILGILGATALVTPLGASAEIVDSDLLWVILATFVLFPIIYLGKMRIDRTMGAFLVFIYVSYIGYLITRI